MSDWAGIGWLVILLIVNAFFVAAEFSIISARRSQIEPRAERGSRAARTALWAMEHATLMLATTQLGITICSLLILNVSEPAIHHLLESPLGLLGWTDAVVGTVSFVIALVLVSFLHVVFGELVPKNLSFSVPERAVLVLAPPLVFFATIFRPVIVALNATANGVLRLARIEPKNEATSAFTVDEVANIVAQSTKEGVLSDTTGALSAAFEFSEKKAQDVAIPLSKLVTLHEDATPSDVEKAVAQKGFSRYVLMNDAGEPTGYLHLKDVIDLDEEEFTEPVPPKRIRKLVSIYRGLELEDALASMQRTETHMARVFDEQGATRGVIFLEDIIEELVGEVQDATRRERY
ncbi:hemolysin family protein [Galbitalea soli]|uniref:HlyC/CorC family transporter n=1 Tax=Galbitalea soli TaxID=1268042 RepID=A0A7C9PLU4_9MICO|nr:hemolysin family protein [Galbitalea soli]NEM90513.1 HlyC/CorC family transporter [Galbitalea soli]NYJ31226.1 CBS domain containing-hemolysin-like protein [Galbitalea soli]